MRSDAVKRFTSRRNWANWWPTPNSSPERAAAQEVALGATQVMPNRALAATLWVMIPQCQMRAAEVIRQVGGSGMIMTPTEKDFANPEIAPYLDKYLQGKNIAARDRVQLFKLAWDMIGEPFGSRQ